ncbi:MAG: hypothetical protein ABIK92_01660 [Pseudomonadota bacterium]
MEDFILQKKGYFIKYLKTISKHVDHGHLFCGQHNIQGAVCPNCNKQLIRFLMIDLRDKRINISIKNKVLSLFFCWKCTLSQEKFFYKIVSDSEIKILKYKIGNPIDDFPYENYPTFFPESYLDLSELTNIEQETIKKLNSSEIDEYMDVEKKYQYLCSPQHQIGGEPYLIQKELELIRCCSCNNTMHLLAAIADDCQDKRGFVGNKFVQVIFYICKKCMVIGAIQRCG